MLFVLWRCVSKYFLHRFQGQTTAQPVSHSITLSVIVSELIEISDFWSDNKWLLSNSYFLTLLTARGGRTWAGTCQEEVKLGLPSPSNTISPERCHLSFEEVLTFCLNSPHTFSLMKDNSIVTRLWQDYLKNGDDKFA
jgi:hypothetical protein